MEFIKKHWVGLSVALILFCMAGLMFFSARGDSMIVDEDAHIPAGFSYITTGDYRLNPEHPPLVKDIAAIPLAITGMKFPYDLWRSNNPVVNNQWEVGWQFIYRSGNNADLMILLARIPMMLLSLLFGFFVFKWATELYGKKAGIFALILYAFNANIIAHSRFVTTDLGISFAFFVNLYFLYRFLKKPNWPNLLWTGLTFGLVMITKFSAAILAPTYIIFWFMLMAKKGDIKNGSFLERINGLKWSQRAWSTFVAFLAIVIIGVTAMWIFYIPHTINMPAGVQRDLITESSVGPFTKPLQAMSGSPVLKPLAQWFLGFAMVTAHVEGGHDAFLLGHVSNQGWWYYYPVVLVLKTQIALFVLVALALVLMKKLPSKKDWFTEWYFWILPIVLLLMGMQGKIDLGIRYMLPIYAFIIVWLSKLVDLFEPRAVLDLVKSEVKKVKGSATVATVTILVTVLSAWYVLAAFFAYPFYLSYFNEFVGGYKNGNKYLTDSNLDWGQDNKRLAEWAEQNGVKKIYVDVFPGPMPAKYYLGNKMVEWHVQNGRPRGYLAVSATFYRSSVAWKKANNNMDYSWLDDIKPVENIGGSILIFDLR